MCKKKIKIEIIRNLSKIVSYSRRSKFTKYLFEKLANSVRNKTAKHSKSENLTPRKQISDEKNVKMTLMLPEGLGLFD